MIDIIIPMSGRGKRFADVGYKDPKPFIKIKNKTLIEIVINNLHLKEDHRFIFICLKDMLDLYSEEFEKVTQNCNKEIITINEITQGAACTVLKAKNLIGKNELFIANCDQLITDPYYMDNSLQFFRKRNADGGIICFLNDSPKWSYVRFNGNTIREVIEKQVISNLATVGIYYYKQGSMFVEAAENMIANNIRVNNEFYVAPAYNGMIVENKKIVPFIINEMHGLGTPEDLKIYEDLQT
jgi:NDP-sugar pyrophosphorylase family protein